MADAFDERARLGMELNRARWEESTPLHADSEFYDLAGFIEGRDDLRPFESDEIGPVTGHAMIHLQCHIGTDTLSWARRGARVVGLDFSARSVEVARRLAVDCALDAEFVCANVYDAVTAVGTRTFDIVYTGIGAIGWLPDLAAWARVVNALLRPGGVLYLVEIHPMVLAVSDDGRTIANDTLDTGFVRSDDEGGTYAAPSAHLKNRETCERAYSISDVLDAVLAAGLGIELFHEQSYTNAPLPWLERGHDGFYRLPEGWPRYPLTFSLRARKPAN